MQEFLDRTTGMQRLLDRTTGMQELLGTMAGMQELLDKAAGMQELLGTTAGMQELLGTTAGMQGLWVSLQMLLSLDAGGWSPLNASCISESPRKAQKVPCKVHLPAQLRGFLSRPTKFPIYFL